MDVFSLLHEEEFFGTIRVKKKSMPGDASASSSIDGISSDEMSSNKHRLSESSTNTLQPSNIEDDEDCCPLPYPLQLLLNWRMAVIKFVQRHSKLFNFLLLLFVLVVIHIFLAFAIYIDFDKSFTLTVLFALGWSAAVYYYIKDRFFGGAWKSCCCFSDTVNKRLVKLRSLLPVKIFLYVTILLIYAGFIIWDTRNDRRRLSGLLGMAFFICFMFLASTNPAKIRWRPVIWGFFLQFLLGLAVLRWDYGSAKFREASEAIVRFVDFTKNGTAFVFGFIAQPPNICGMSPVFAFTALQVLIYFAAIVSLLYYCGVVQKVLRKMAWLMQSTMGTTAVESLNACACVFVGMTEAPLLVRPYLEMLTVSELHAVLTSGFSTIAGSLFAAYVSFGACPSYLLSATVMSAPGSLACSKLLCPETEVSKFADHEKLELPPCEEKTILECLCNAAISAVQLVFAVVANLIVFVALLAFVDSVAAWLGSLVGQSGWSMELFVGYLFFPVAYVMGVNENLAETLNVAKLMGVKTVVNEFVAYQKLGEMVDHDPPLLTPRSQMIATYALCGFSNLCSVSIQLGILGTMAPSKKNLLARLALRTLMAGAISCFFTACLAGVLVEIPELCKPTGMNSHCFKLYRNYTGLF